MISFLRIRHVRNSSFNLFILTSVNSFHLWSTCLVIWEMRCICILWACGILSRPTLLLTGSTLLSYIAPYCNLFLRTGDWYNACAGKHFPTFVVNYLTFGKRYKDSKDSRHLANAAKYLLSIITIGLAGARKAHTDAVGLLVVYSIVASISTLFSWAWDIRVDWGLGFWGSHHHFMLRERLESLLLITSACKS